MTADDLQAFSQFVFTLHGMKPPLIKQIHMIFEQSIAKENEIHFLASKGEKLIGGITLSMGKTAGLWNFAILPGMRKQGNGAVLLQKVLETARQRGYQKVMSILMPTAPRNVWSLFHFQEICHFPFHACNPH